MKNRWLILAIVSTALFFIVIDMTILYTALPILTHDLKATASQKLWIINAYTLVMAGLLPGLGTLGDALGHKRMFIAGLVVFGLASLIAAFAPSASVLIAARVILAIGAAMMMPATLSIIRLVFLDEKERSLAIGVWASVSSGGAALGPLIGGILLESYWWGAVFLVNVPFVLVAIVCAYVALDDESHEGKQRIEWDLVGSIQVLVGLIGVTFGIKEFGTIEPSYPLSLASFAVGGMSLLSFYRRCRSRTVPLIDFDLFQNMRFASGVAAAVMSAFALIGVHFVLSQKLQLVSGLSPFEAGLFMLPVSLFSFVMGPIAGIFSHRIGVERFLPAALLTMGLGIVGFFVSERLGLGNEMWYQPSQWFVLLCLSLFGAGIGAAMTTASSVIMNSAPASRAGMAASVEEVSYEIGGATGVTILGSLMGAVYTASMASSMNASGTTGSASLAAELSTESKMLLDSLDQAILASEALTAMSPQLAATIVDMARASFLYAFDIVTIAAATVIFLAAGVTYVLLRRPSNVVSRR